MASQITDVSIVCLIICSGADKKNIKVTRKMFPFDDVIMKEVDLSVAKPPLNFGDNFSSLTSFVK